MREYDVVVIGGGPAGENAADHAIRGSSRTALIVERELLGGECSYYACMPSKALLRPLDVAATANHLSGITTPVGVDRAALLARRDEWVHDYDDGSQVSWAEDAGIEIARGTGRLAGERRVDVVRDDGSVQQVLAREAVVIATGGVPVLPPPYAGVHPWTSRDATGVLDVPDRIVVVGGGVVACEAATWLSGLGSRVTVLVRGQRLLDRAERFAGEAVLAALRDRGVDVRFGVEATAADRPDGADTGLGRVHGGPVTLTIGAARGGDLTRVTDASAERLVADEVLVATGRRAATRALGLETVGLEPEALAATAGDPLPDWLYAVGDVTGEAPLTHWGKYRARQVGARIAARAERRTLPAAPTRVPVPQVVFTDPQVAWVGPTEEQARESGLVTRVLEADYTSAAGAALVRDDAAGTVRLVVDDRTRELVGATFVGPEVAELLHAATVAIVGRLTIDTLAHAVPSYPTASEVWLRLLDQA